MARTIFSFFMGSLGAVIITPPAVLFFLLSFFGLKRPMAYLTYKLGQGWGLLVIAVTGCTCTVSGKEYIPRKGSFCLVANHNSILDIALLLAIVGRPFGFIAKKELAAVPVFNFWILFLGGLFIDRNNIRKAIGTINEGIRRIKSGGAMVVFPEGTRSKGRGMLPFKPGSLKLATKSGTPIVPVAISGTYEVFEKTGRVHAVPVSVYFAPPIATNDIPAEERGDLPAQVQAIVEGLLKKAEGAASV
ncbi:1-acyl-sn-glycerol-3-phosphate acyltransferase [Spirochaetia bacterium]|nr:1-acyl-sn-glycerol-3-phosphate acyltransferase [Spirochaetia bacterium]